MFGALRFLLAAMVIWTHFYAPIGAPFAGTIAVFGFYCLSGYLMTSIINGPYADGWRGFVRYLGNRALRIYPAYLTMAALVAAALLTWPGFAAAYGPGVFEPAHLLPSLTIFGLFPGDPTFSQPAWTLSVEMLHYILIGAAFGRSRRATVAWFAASLALRIFGPILSGNIPLEWYYFSPIGSSLAFASGAMLWHFRDIAPASRAPVAVATIAVLIIYSGFMTIDAGLSWGLPVSLIVSAAVIAMLRDLPSGRIDSAVGALSYPMYLFHSPAEQAARVAIGSEGTASHLLALAMTAALSVATVAVVEQPIMRIRQRIRTGEIARPERAPIPSAP